MRYVVRPLGPWDRPVTERRQSASVFRTSWSRTLDDLEYELHQLRASNVVLMVDARERDIRVDGTLRADAKVTFPGVKIAFESKFGPLTYASDAYVQQWRSGLPSWQANVRAIALGLEALRAVDRYGISSRGEQYVGWKALPAGIGLGATHMTTETALAIIFAESQDRQLDDLKAAPPLNLSDVDAVRATIRAAKKHAHPDRNGGDDSRWRAVDAASQLLERLLS